MEDNVVEALLSLIKVLDKAISLERNATSFYSNAAAVTQEPTGIFLFTKLAEEEQRHVDDLIDQRKQLASHRSVKGQVPELRTDNTLSEISSSFLFRPGMTSEEILQEGIKNERKTYAYYTKKSSFTDDPSVKSLFKQLAQDEDNHWASLRTQLGNFQSGHGWVEPTCR